MEAKSGPCRKCQYKEVLVLSKREVEEGLDNVFRGGEGAIGDGDVP